MLQLPVRFDNDRGSVVVSERIGVTVNFRITRRQTEILEWIGAGCPEQDWPDYAHRQTARALSARGLVVVQGRGPAWTATITDAGRALLERPHTTQNPPPKATKQQKKNGLQHKAKKRQVAGETVLKALVSGDGALTISDPSEDIRAAYRRALFVLQQEQLPDGRRVTYTGRNHGDLVIRLTTASRPERPRLQAPVPSEPNPRHPVVAALRPRLGELDLASSSHDRVLRIHQALADEAALRGYECNVPSSAEDEEPAPTLRLKIGEVEVSFYIHEEKTKVSTASADQLEHARYDWQRIPSVMAEQWSGRLVLTLSDDSRDRRWWADRKRWSLEDRLPQALQSAEKYAEQVQTKRAEAEAARQERLSTWNDAVPKARAAYVAALNRDRAETQVADFQRSLEFRAYANAVKRTISTLPTNQQPAATAWAVWLREEADRSDPLQRPDRLTTEEPEGFPFTEVDRYMPRGFTSRRPPE